MSDSEPGAVMKRQLTRRWVEELKATVTAAAFAEECDVETARRLLAEARKDEPGGA